MEKDENILLIDKPAGWTSFDVVAKIRGKIRAEYAKKNVKPTKKQLRVGHADTLDPFATGLLIILLGESCKKAGEFLKLDKQYEFTAKLGQVSSTGDTEGEILDYRSQNLDLRKSKEGNVAVIPVKTGIQSLKYEGSESNNHPTIDEVNQALKQFEGEITQIPPAFSAIKINGQRAYKLAREGKEVVVPPRQVTVNNIELIEYNFPYLKCRCDVSSGTYIRTLVEDIGRKLNTGAYCIELRRTKIDNYCIENVQSIDKI